MDCPAIDTEDCGTGPSCCSMDSTPMSWSGCPVLLPRPRPDLQTPSWGDPQSKQIHRSRSGELAIWVLITGEGPQLPQPVRPPPPCLTPPRQYRSWVDASQRLVRPPSQVEHRFGRSHPVMIESGCCGGIDGTVVQCHPGRGLTREIYDRSVQSQTCRLPLRDVACHRATGRVPMGASPSFRRHHGSDRPSRPVPLTLAGTSPVGGEPS